MKKRIWIAGILAVLLGLAGCAEGQGVLSPTAAPTDAPTAQPSDASTEPPAVAPTMSPTPADSASPTPDATASPAPSGTATDTPSDAPSAAVTATPSPMPTAQNLDAIEALDGKKQTWGPGKEMDDDNRPVAALQLQEQFGSYDAIFSGEKTETLYLTFDEGYENGYTGQILDTLKAKGVQATFFVTYPYVQKNPDLVRRMIDEGHVVGNHTWNHPSLPTLSLEEMRDEIMKLHNYVESNFGYSMSILRPPMGEFSPQSLAMTQALGYKTALWSFAYADWDPDKQMGPEAALQKITAAAHPGAVYLLHAVSRDNAQILGSWIDRMQQEGYGILPLR